MRDYLGEYYRVEFRPCLICLCLQCDSRVQSQSENAVGFLEFLQASVRQSLSEESQVPNGPKRVGGYMSCRTKAYRYPRAMAFMVFALVALLCHALAHG